MVLLIKRKGFVRQEKEKKKKKEDHYTIDIFTETRKERKGRSVSQFVCCGVRRGLVRDPNIIRAQMGWPQLSEHLINPTKR